MNQYPSPETWGLCSDTEGELCIGNQRLTELASVYGTPLHVIHARRLEETARRFRSSVGKAYRGKTSVHYALKCNSVPEVVDIIRRAGLDAEVMTEYELQLCLRMGYRPEQLIVNGPCKTASFISECVKAGVRFIIVDSPDELYDLQACASETGSNVDILLRINPDYVPAGMNSGTATGSRKGCAFGLDMKSGEGLSVLRLLRTLPSLRFHGFHFHIGTGIRRPKEYTAVIRRIKPIIDAAYSENMPVEVLNVGGGLASGSSRGLSGREMITSYIWKKPHRPIVGTGPSFDEYARAVAEGIEYVFGGRTLPEVMFEPGRCIASQNQFLLLTVHRVKERKGVNKWLMTDGGISTAAVPMYFEYHEILLCNDVTRKRSEKVTITGPACFADDIVCRSMMMPSVKPGEVIAIMDSGAYFTAMESSFGFPLPAIVAVDESGHHLVRRRQSFGEMIGRDELYIDDPQRAHGPRGSTKSSIWM
jgi:diaminopimelate decarboxylase